MTYGDAQCNALGDPTRRAILFRLARGPLAVGELARHLPVSRPAVSQHLKILKESGLVFDRQKGTRRLYRLDPHGLERLRTYFDRLWSSALTAFKEMAEQHSSEEPS